MVQQLTLFEEFEELELDLFVYGPQMGGVVFPRAEAEQAAQARIGTRMIMPGQLLQIVSVRLEDDPAFPDGSRGSVIARCNVLSEINYAP